MSAERKQIEKARKYRAFYEKVNRLLEEYIGGQVFFTELDKAVKFDEDILVDLVNAAINYFGKDNILTVASGEIGLALHNFGIPVDILVPGGLRFDPSKINLEPYKTKIENKKVVFIDDSYFSGRTFKVIEEEITRVGGCMLAAYVAYDGAKERNPEVHSLYRYFDHFDILGRPIKIEE